MGKKQSWYLLIYHGTDVRGNPTREREKAAPARYERGLLLQRRINVDLAFQEVHRGLGLQDVVNLGLLAFNGCRERGLDVLR